MASWQWGLLGYGFVAIMTMSSLGGSLDEEDWGFFSALGIFALGLFWPLFLLGGCGYLIVHSVKCHYDRKRQKERYRKWAAAKEGIWQKPNKWDLEYHD